MDCPNCKTQMIWNSDIDFEDQGLEGQGIITFYSCPACYTWTESYTPIPGMELNEENNR